MTWEDILDKGIFTVGGAAVATFIAWLTGRRKMTADIAKTDAESIQMLVSQVTELSSKLTQTAKDIADAIHKHNECLAREIIRTAQMEKMQAQLNDMQRTQEQNVKTITELSCVVDNIKKEVIT